MQTSIFKIQLWNKSIQSLLIYLFLLVAPLLVFFQAKNFEFVNFDDTMYVMHNEHVQSGLTLDNVKWAFSTLEIESWQPLMWLSLMLDYEIYGLNAGGFHLTNMFLHILSTLLLFWFMNQITGLKWRSAFVAAFFAITPVHVESVAWIAERKDTISALFFMLTLCMYAAYTKKPNIKRYCFLLLAFIIGLMSKPVVVTLPIIFILLDYWPLGRISSTTQNVNVDKSNISLFSTKGHFFKIPLWQIKEKLPFFLLSLTLGIIVLLKAQGAQNVITGNALHPLDSRIFNAFVSYTTYIFKIFTPYNLAVFYPFNESIPVIRIILSVLVFLLLGVIAILSIKRYPFIFVGWSWYVIILAPIIGIIPLGKEALTDRYTYLSSIGLSFVLAWGVPLLLKRSDTLKKLLIPISAIYLGTLGYLAWVQCGYWENSMTLFSRALAVTENNDLMHYNVAWLYTQRGDFETAKEHLHEALRINPHNDSYYTNLGAISMQQGDQEKAMLYYTEGIKLNPLSQTLHYNMGKLYEDNGNFEKAIEHFERAISINPNFIQPYESLAALQFQQGDTEKALEIILRAVKENPRYEKGHYLLANYYASNQNPTEAIKHLNTVLEINPKNVEARYNLGIVYSMINNVSAARKQLEMALRIRPDYLPAMQALNKLSQ